MVNSNLNLSQHISNIEQSGQTINYTYFDLNTSVCMVHVFIPMSHEYDVKIKTHAMVASSGDTRISK